MAEGGGMDKMKVTPQPAEGAKKDPMEDPAKRQDVYQKAETKAKELLASDDPRKKEKGQQILEKVKQARQLEYAYGKDPERKEMAINLERSLRMIARREAGKKAPSARKVSSAEAAKLAAELNKLDAEMMAKLSGKPAKEGPEGRREVVARLGAEKLPPEVVAKLDTKPIEQGQTALVDYTLRDGTHWRASKKVVSTTPPAYRYQTKKIG